MKNTLETRLGIFFALALIAAFLIMEMIGSFDFFKRGIRVHAQFNTVQELKEGDPAGQRQDRQQSDRQVRGIDGPEFCRDPLWFGHGSQG